MIDGKLRRVGDVPRRRPPRPGGLRREPDGRRARRGGPLGPGAGLDLHPGPAVLGRTDLRTATAIPTTTSRTTARWSRGPAGPKWARGCRNAERTGSMIDRRSSALVRAMTSLLIVVFAGAARAEDLRREVDALRQDDRTDREAAMLDNLERRAREALAAIPRSRTARDADRMREPLRRELGRSLGVGRLPWPPALRPRVVGILRRDGYRIEKVVYDSLPGSPVPAHLYVPEGLDRPRAGRPVLPRPLVARQQGPARTSRPSASTWPGSASSCSASTRSARGSGASRRATTAAPRRCWSGSPSRGSPSTRPAARWSTCSPAPRSIRSGSG